jgi:hypothetical protein
MRAVFCKALTLEKKRRFQPGLPRLTDTIPLRTADGRSLFFSSSIDTFPARVYRLDLATGRRELWKEFMPSDPTGITNIGPSAISADGKTILFGYSHTLSDLYVAEGLR